MRYYCLQYSDVYSTEINIANVNETKEETEQELNIVSHLWDSNNQLYCGTGDRRLLKYDSTTLKLVENITTNSENSITTLVLSKQSLITGSQSGRLTWLSLQQKYQVDYALEFLDPISNVVYSPDYSYIIIGTTMGGLHSLAVGDDSAPTKGKPTRVLDCHKGDITGLAAFSLQHFAVTCGVDGTLRIWDYTKPAKNTAPIGKIQLDTPQSCVATNKKDHLFAVGGDNGVVRIYEAHNVRRPLLLNSTKVHAGKVTSIKFSLSVTMCTSYWSNNCRENTLQVEVLTIRSVL
jgi:WD40 repeat protein